MLERLTRLITQNPPVRQSISQQLAAEVDDRIISKVDGLGLRSGEKDHTSGDYGAKIWLLPRRYYGWMLNGRKLRMSLYEYLTHARLMPGLSSPCKVNFGNPTSSTAESTMNRPIGGGNIGLAMFDSEHGFDSFVAFAHDVEFAQRAEKMSRARFRRIGREITLGLGRKEYVRLSTTYGAMLAIPLVTSDHVVGATAMFPPFGVLTVHTRSGYAWETYDAVFAVYELARPAAIRVTKALLKEYYKIPESSFGLE